MRDVEPITVSPGVDLEQHYLDALVPRRVAPRPGVSGRPDARSHPSASWLGRSSMSFAADRATRPDPVLTGVPGVRAVPYDKRGARLPAGVRGPPRAKQRGPRDETIDTRIGSGAFVRGRPERDGYGHAGGRPGGDLRDPGRVRERHQLHRVQTYPGEWVRRCEHGGLRGGPRDPTVPRDGRAGLARRLQ